MADKNAPSSNKGDFWQSSFWQSWWGKATALLALWFFLPTDEVLEKGVKPTFAAGQRALRKGWHEVRAAGAWLSEKGRNIFWWFLLVSILALNGVFIGIHLHHGVIVALSGGFYALFLLFMWFLLRAGVGVIVEAAMLGKDLTGSLLGGILTKMGIKMKDGSPTGESVASIKKFVNDAFVVVPLAFAGTALLAIAPDWTSFGYVIVAAVMFGLAMSTAVFKKLPTDSGWRALFRWSVRIGVIFALLAIAHVLLPKIIPLFVSKNRAAAFEACTADPDRSSLGCMLPSMSFGLTTIVIMLVAVPAALWIASAMFPDDDKKSRVFKIMAKLSLGIIPLAILIMCLNGTITWPGIKKKADEFKNGTAAERTDSERKPSGQDGTIGTLKRMDGRVFDFAGEGETISGGMLDQAPPPIPGDTAGPPPHADPSPPTVQKPLPDATKSVDNRGKSSIDILTSSNW
jgi:uncharacterized membrane protein